MPVVLYDAGEGLVPAARETFASLGLTNVCELEGGLRGWQDAGYELFQDVNSYAKAFGELVEQRRHTPSLPADDVAALISSAAIAMNLPTSTSVSGLTHDATCCARPFVSPRSTPLMRWIAATV